MCSFTQKERAQINGHSNQTEATCTCNIYQYVYVLLIHKRKRLNLPDNITEGNICNLLCENNFWYMWNLWNRGDTDFLKFIHV